MNRRHPNLIRLATLCLGTLPALALAHPGHGEEMSFVAGALHPTTGIDHIAGFLVVGILFAQLRVQNFRPIAAALLGLLVAAGSAGGDGWQYAAGFMLTGLSLAAVAVTATRLSKRSLTAAARRSRTWAASAAPARRLFASR